MFLHMHMYTRLFKRQLYTYTASAIATRNMQAWARVAIAHMHLQTIDRLLPRRLRSATAVSTRSIRSQIPILSTSTGAPSPMGAAIASPRANSRANS